MQRNTLSTIRLKNGSTTSVLSAAFNTVRRIWIKRMQFARVDAGHVHQNDVVAWKGLLSFETFSLMHRTHFMALLNATFLDWMLTMLSGPKWMTKKSGRWHWAFKLRSTSKRVWINTKSKWKIMHFIYKSLFGCRNPFAVNLPYLNFSLFMFQPGEAELTCHSTSFDVVRV